MMIERHYDDEALIALIEANRAASDAHIPRCAACSDKVESFRTLAECLADAEVWDTRELRTEAVPATIATLRAFADRMADEDARAALILPELLAGPREEWMPRLQEHPEWRMAGVVRGLIRAAERAVDTMPPDAVAMSFMAAYIADHLVEAPSAPKTLLQLCGGAWRDHAYALFYTGRFAEAQAAVTVAENYFNRCAVDEYERARLGIVRSLVLRALERFDEASATAASSADAFAFFNDAHRHASARLAQVHLLFSRSDFLSAEAILQALDKELARTDDVDTHARVLGNLGYCSWKLGRVDDALRYHEASAALHETLGVATEAARIRWNVASILAGAGRIDEARRRFETLRDKFDELGMTSEATLVRLDIAEVILATGNFSEVEALCRAAMRSFEAAGISYTARALTALAYIQEAARQRTATPALVRHVRTYIRQLPQNANLLFAPPPL